MIMMLADCFQMHFCTLCFSTVHSIDPSTNEVLKDIVGYQAKDYGEHISKYYKESIDLRFSNSFRLQQAIFWVTFIVFISTILNSRVLPKQNF